MFHPQSWLSRALEWSPMRALGRISYGLYLWQQLFFVHLAQTTPSSLGRAQAAPWNLIWTVVFAMISYFLLEKPLIRLGHRLAPPPTPGHKDLDVQLKPVVPVQTDSVFPKV
jgi:peptidoglycan/LPS O-acetylase OafA/YrhL